MLAESFRILCYFDWIDNYVHQMLTNVRQTKHMTAASTPRVSTYRGTMHVSAQRDITVMDSFAMVSHRVKFLTIHVQEFRCTVLLYET